MVWLTRYFYNGRSNAIRAQRASEFARLQQESLGRRRCITPPA